MILTDVSKVISAAPSDLQGAKIIDERLLTTDELAVLLGVSRQTLSRMAKSGGLPFVMVGGAIRYNLRAIDAHVTANTVRGAPIDTVAGVSRATAKDSDES